MAGGSILAAPPKDTPFFGKNNRISDAWVTWLSSITTTATIVENLQSLTFISEDGGGSVNTDQIVSELLDVLGLSVDPPRPPAPAPVVDSDWRAECSALREELRDVRALLAAGEPAPFGALGSAAFSNTAAFDAAGAASAAVAAIPTSSGAQTQPALITPADWSTFNSKQGALSLPLAITQGGTGATSAAAALTALGAVSLSAANTFTALNTFTAGIKLNNVGTINCGISWQFLDPTNTFASQRFSSDGNGALHFESAATAGGWVNALSISTAGVATFTGGINVLLGSVSAFAGSASFSGAVNLQSGAAATCSNGVSLRFLDPTNAFTTQRIYSDGSGNFVLDSAASSGAFANALRVSTAAGVSITNAAGLSIGSNWQAWTPAVTATGSMTVTGVNNALVEFYRLGNLVHFHCYILFTLGGAASNNVAITLPVASFSASLPQSVTCNVVAGNWQTGFAYIQDSHIYAFMAGQGNFTLGASGVLISGTYRVA